MVKHKDPKIVYSQYIMHRNFVLTCFVSGMIDEDKKNKHLAQHMLDCIARIGEENFEKFNDNECTQEYEYMGRSI